jgi:hypothetical protein
MPLTRHRKNRLSKYIIKPRVKLVTISVPEALIHHTTGGYLRKAHTFVRKIYGQITLRRYKQGTSIEMRLNPPKFNNSGLPKGINDGMFNTSRDLNWYHIFKSIKNDVNQRRNSRMHQSMKKKGISLNPVITIKQVYIQIAKQKRLRKVA